MISKPNRIAIATIALALGCGGTVAGCSDAAGSSRGGSLTGANAAAGSSTAGSTTGSGTTGGGLTSNDFDPPEVTITNPARGAYFDGNPAITVEGQVRDVGSGVQTFTVNGAAVAPDAQGRFSLPVQLADGVNIITARALDRAGHEAASSISVMYCPVYRLATDGIDGAAGSRLNESALNGMAPGIARALVSSGIVQQKLTSAPLFHDDVRDPFFNACIASAEVSVLSIQFDTPQIAFDAVPGGFNATIHVPNLDVAARASSYCGISYSVAGSVSATDAVVEVGLDVALASGHYTVAARQASVTLNGFRWGINGLPAAITNIVQGRVRSTVENRLEDAIRTQVPSALQTELQKLAQPISRTWNGRTVTFRVSPSALAFDDAGFQVGFDGNVTAARQPFVPLVPGSVFLPAPAGQVPSFATSPGFYATVNENIVNRALFASWQAGFWHITIDGPFLQQYGLTAPFQLDSHLIASFFPQLQGMVTPGTSIPVALKLEPQMQPLVHLTGTPDLCEVELGELHLSLLMDFGAGYTEIFKTALHLRAGANAGFANDALSFSITQNLRFEADLLSQAVTFNGLDIERFLAFLLPSAMQVATNSMAPIPLPTVQGLSLRNLAIYRDGARGEFCTVRGDVR